MHGTKGPLLVTDRRAAVRLARVNAGGHPREKRPGRKTDRAIRPFPLQVSTRLNLLPDSEYCTLHFTVNSQLQTTERLSGKQEHKPKSGGNTKKIKGARTKPSRHPPHKTCNAKSKHLIYPHGLTLSFFMIISVNTRQKTSAQLCQVARRLGGYCRSNWRRVPRRRQDNYSRHRG